MIPNTGLAVLFLGIFSGCVHIPWVGDGDRLLAQRRDTTLRPLPRAGAGLTPRVAARATPAARGLVHVYVEGDGFAFRNRYRQSSDPTPRDPLALRLAEADSAANVIYLARPCQYLQPAALKVCAPRYWAAARYAPEVIEAVDAALSRLLEQLGLAGRGLHLVGYSGGGAVAALLAARRTNVARLTTVAANLDIAAWTRMQNVSPLTGSRNPMDIAAQIGNIPQLHYAGADDAVVPVAIVRRFVSAVGSKQARLTVMAGFDHRCCWVRDWPRLLAEAGDLTASEIRANAHQE